MRTLAVIVKEVPGQWVTEGQTYTVEQRPQGGDVWFIGRLGSTFMTERQFRRAVREGQIVIITKGVICE